MVLAALSLTLSLSSCGEEETAHVPVIAYHGMTTDPEAVEDPADVGFFDVRLLAFEAQMAYLHDAGYHTITPSQDMRASGRWIVQFHAGPMGHAYADDPADPTCHRFFPRWFGEDDETYQARVKSDVAQGGAMRSAFDPPGRLAWNDLRGPVGRCGF